MVNLCYSYLSKLSSEPKGECLSASRSKLYFDTITDWCPPLAELALDALFDAYEDAHKDDEGSGYREFFRERKQQELVGNRFDKVILREERWATREGKTLQVKLGLPSA